MAFWRAALHRRLPVHDIRRWFYVAGASLEDADAGRKVLMSLFDNLGGHLQDHRLDEPKLPWDHFVECISAMYRNVEKQHAILALKQPSTAPPSVIASYRKIEEPYKASADTVRPELIDSMLARPDRSN